MVTGAGGAIGSAVVAAVRHAGGTTIATDLAAGTGADTPLDVTSESDWQRVTADIERDHGRLDGLVNAAGIAAVGSIEKTDFASWRRVLSVNLDGTFLGCKHMFALLRKRGGSIVNLSSVLGLVGSANLPAYSASKGGVSLLSKSVALHGARYKPAVRCNAVCPAFVDGPMVDDIAHSTNSAGPTPCTNDSSGYCIALMQVPAITSARTPKRTARGTTTGRITRRPRKIDASDTSTSGKGTPARNR